MQAGRRPPLWASARRLGDGQVPARAEHRSAAFGGDGGPPEAAGDDKIGSAAKRPSPGVLRSGGHDLDPIVEGEFRNHRSKPGRTSHAPVEQYPAARGP